MGVKRAVKAILFLGGGLFLAATLIGILIPSRIVVTRSVEVNADARTTFSQISDLRNWHNWQPAMKSVSGAAFSEDSILFVSGEKQYSIVNTEKKFPFVKFDLRAAGELPVNNIVTVDSSSSVITVSWVNITSLRWYPWQKFKGLFLERIAGESTQASLNALKAYVEKS